MTMSILGLRVCRILFTVCPVASLAGAAVPSAQSASGAPGAVARSGSQSAALYAASIAKADRRAQHRNNDCSRALCSKCARPPAVCVCAALPREPLATATRVLVLQHPNEAERKTVSTVPLLPLCLRDVEVRVGYAFAADSLAPLQEELRAGRRPLLLFPGPDAFALDGGGLDGGGARHELDGDDAQGRLLVLLDGTWSQARSIARASPSLLASCRQVAFAEAADSAFDAVRREPERHCVSTLEACGRALELLEPESAAVRAANGHLHAALNALVAGQLRNYRRAPRFTRKARRRKEDCQIPD